MSDEGESFKAKAKGRPKSDVQGFSKALRALQSLARQSKRSGSSGSSGSSRPSRGSPVVKSGNSQQRCSVRLTYAKNKGDGQWSAHGKYIARESASLESELEINKASDIAVELSEQLIGNELEADPHLPTQKEVENGTPRRSDVYRGRDGSATQYGGRDDGGRYDIAPDRADAGRISALHQPYLSQYRRESTAKSLNSVRNLSSVGVVKFARRTEMLLSRHAPGQLEHGGAERPDALRRGNNGKPRTGTRSEQVKGSNGFGSAGNDMPIAETLASWQKSKDEHLFKLIISPEFGERMQMQQHTKQLVAQMEKDLGTPLQWVAVEHFNTEHPHVHLAVRGIDASGRPLRIGKEYIKTGIRSRAQQIATNQLGYRTADDMKLAAERQIVQQRFTEIDRSLQRKGKDQGNSYLLDYTGRIPTSPVVREARLREIRRLQQLAVMGLARKTGPLSWKVDKSFEQALRQIQTANDRLKSLHEQRTTLSDPRLPLVSTDTRNVKRLAGRVIGTGLDENRGIPYLLLEGTDAKVHYLYHDRAIDEARRAGKMQPGSFVEIERTYVQGEDGRKRPQIVITDKGSAEALLTNQKHLSREALRGAVNQPELPEPSSYGGWLGRYHRAVSIRATQLVSQGQLKPGPNGYEYHPARAQRHSRS